MFKVKISPKKIICPECHGSGLRQGDGQCFNCSGAGLGYLFDGRLYYWQSDLSSTSIYLKRLRRALDWLLDSVLFVASFAGLWGLVNWLVSIEFAPEIFFRIWLAKSHFLLYFWGGLFSAMYLLFRISTNLVSRQGVDYKATKNPLNDNDDAPNDLTLRKIGNQQRFNVIDGFRINALGIIDKAFLLAQKSRHSEVTALHLLIAALHDSEVRELFYRLELDVNGFSQKLQNQLAKLPNIIGAPRLDITLRQCLLEGFFNGYGLQQTRIKTINILPALHELDGRIAELFLDFDVSLAKLTNAVTWFRINDKLRENFKNYQELSRFKPASQMNRSYTAMATPLLNNFSRDLTLAAKYCTLAMCIARETEIVAIFEAFQSGKQGVLLVGDEGVGKKTIVGGLAQLMVEENVPEILKDKRLVELDVARLVSGVDPAQAEERLLSVIDEIVYATNIVIVINNIEMLVGISAGSEASLDLADVLVNALDRSGILCVATVTSSNYAKFIETKPLGMIMQKVVIKEPETTQAIEMLESKISRLENSSNARFTYAAIEAAVIMTSRYQHEKSLPDKAISILNALAVSHAGGGVISKDAVAKVISEQTGILLTKVAANEGKELLKLEEKMHQFMIGQPEAVTMVAASLRRARAQLTDGKRPIASFLFLGPTGVGKTELAKTLAKTYFGGEQYMVRLDMSEYQEQGSVAKMIGISEDDKGYLTEAVRQKPFCLLLLDEFEKAHPDVLNLFLQVMDDGRLTDGAGQTIDFTNCIIIATSNAGANFIQAEIKNNTALEIIKEMLINEHLNKIMRPELINRFDGLIVFKPLTEADILAIAKLSLDKISKNLAERGMNFHYSEMGAAVLSKLGYDVKFGARPLRRLLQDRIENKIADRILSGDLKRRDTLIINDSGEVEVKKAAIL